MNPQGPGKRSREEQLRREGLVRDAEALEADASAIMRRIPDQTKPYMIPIMTAEADELYARAYAIRDELARIAIAKANNYEPFVTR